MKKLTSIVLGWIYYLTNRNNDLARKRLLICAHCELRKGLVCGVCFCPLQTKARVPDEVCPHPDRDKWRVMIPDFKIKTRPPQAPSHI